VKEGFALPLEKGNVYGYIKKEEYNNLSEEFRKNYFPIVETENFYLFHRKEKGTRFHRLTGPGVYPGHNP
jgi:hypothetical protein